MVSLRPPTPATRHPADTLRVSWCSFLWRQTAADDLGRGNPTGRHGPRGAGRHRLPPFPPMPGMLPPARHPQPCRRRWPAFPGGPRAVPPEVHPAPCPRLPLAAPFIGGRPRILRSTIFVLVLRRDAPCPTVCASTSISASRSTCSRSRQTGSGYSRFDISKLKSHSGRTSCFLMSPAMPFAIPFSELMNISVRREPNPSVPRGSRPIVRNPASTLRAICESLWSSHAMPKCDCVPCPPPLGSMLELARAPA